MLCTWMGSRRPTDAEGDPDWLAPVKVPAVKVPAVKVPAVEGVATRLALRLADAAVCMALSAPRTEALGAGMEEPAPPPSR